METNASDKFVFWGTDYEPSSDKTLNYDYSFDDVDFKFNNVLKHTIQCSINDFVGTRKHTSIFRLSVYLHKGDAVMAELEAITMNNYTIDEKDLNTFFNMLAEFNNGKETIERILEAVPELKSVLKLDEIK